jgi:hypothetical protein
LRGSAVPEVGQNKHLPLSAKKRCALVGLSEFSKLKLDKAGKTADVRVQKRWIFLTGIGSLGKVGNNGIQQFSFCNLTTEWSHFATTICRYVFESVKSTD